MGYGKRQTIVVLLFVTQHTISSPAHQKKGPLCSSEFVATAQKEALYPRRTKVKAIQTSEYNTRYSAKATKLLYRKCVAILKKEIIVLLKPRKRNLGIFHKNANFVFHVCMETFLAFHLIQKSYICTYIACLYFRFMVTWKQGCCDLFLENKLICRMLRFILSSSVICLPLTTCSALKVELHHITICKNGT